jgi:hypothetical protein
MADDKDEQQVNEPLGFYESRKITFYKSFEEEHAAKIAYYAGLSMQERMYLLNQLLRQIYGTEFGPDKKIGTKIYFD